MKKFNSLKFIGAILLLYMFGCFGQAFAQNAVDLLPQAAPVQQAIVLQLPREDPVVFQGVVNYDAAGIGQQGMVYGPGPAGFVVSMLVHGLVLDAAKTRQKEQFRKDADLVLGPIQPILETFTHTDLMQRSLAKQVPSTKPWTLQAQPVAGAWVLETTPVFSMTQDRTTLIVDNLISVRKPGQTVEEAYRNTVRVISRARAEGDALEAWMNSQGEVLKDESAALLAESVAIALGDVDAAKPAAGLAFKTVRYLEGKTERMERAQLISEGCSRLVIRSLRGGLMSVPLSTEAGTETCSGRSEAL